MNDILKAIQDALNSQGVTAAAASRAAVGNASLIKNMMNARGENPRYSYQALEKLAEVLDLELYFGPKRQPEQFDHLAHVAGQNIPHLGMARCSLYGWADDLIQREVLPRPNWVADDAAFWVSAEGRSMEREGIYSGDYCIVSPDRKPQIGDRVWVREATAERRVSIKRLIEMDTKSAVLRGWLPPENGAQSDFTETRPLSAIAEMHPVIGVYRGRLGKAGVDVRFVPDPRNKPHVTPDDFHVLQLVDQVIAASDRWRFPSELGFPRSWFARRHLSPEKLALVAVQDNDLAPMIPQWALAMIDTSHTNPRGRDLMAFRRSNTVKIRWIQQLPGDALLFSGSDQSEEPEMLSSAKLSSVEILGRVIWSGGSL